MGEPKIGKTALLHHLGWWWQNTGFINQVFYFGYDEKWRHQQILLKIAENLFEVDYNAFKSHAVEKQRNIVANNLYRKRHLLIFDALEYIAESEKTALRDLLSHLVGGKTLVLLGSPTEEKWLAAGTFADNIYQLSGRSGVNNKELLVNNKPQIDIFHLPIPTTKLVGRTENLTDISNAFNDKNTYVIGIIAAGGIGKSALIDEWLERMKKENYGRAQYVFGWSFYSQGTHNTQTSSTQFFENALPFFGHVDTQSLMDDVARARRLAQLLRKQSCILVLDGVEPLQNHENVEGGRLKDLGLSSLLRDVQKHGLAAHSLIVVSSRQTLVELESQRRQHYQQIDLQSLNDEDGTTLLKSLGVQGLPWELKAAVNAYGGHALALVLFGSLLVELFECNINKYHELPLLEDEKQGAHARRVMRFYDEHWAENEPERIFLNLLGLFDRPMSHAEKETLFKQAEIAQPLANLSEIQWKRMLAHLRKLGLLLEKTSSLHIETYDTHPLIRHYFGEQLRIKHPSAWQQAHHVLFKHFQSVPDKEQPDTLTSEKNNFLPVIFPPPGCSQDMFLH